MNLVFKLNTSCKFSAMENNWFVKPRIESDELGLGKNVLSSLNGAPLVGTQKRINFCVGARLRESFSSTFPNSDFWFLNGKICKSFRAKVCAEDVAFSWFIYDCQTCDLLFRHKLFLHAAPPGSNWMHNPQKWCTTVYRVHHCVHYMCIILEQVNPQGGIKNNTGYKASYSEHKLLWALFSITHELLPFFIKADRVYLRQEV